jgi:hypothetical protein
MFTEKDQQQIKAHGLELSTVEQQIRHFEEGFPPSKLVEPALEGNGLKIVDEDELSSLSDVYAAYAKNHKVVKFVPASGAATRMFKNLFSFRSSYDHSEAAYEKLVADQSQGSMFDFFKRLEYFAFYDDLKVAFKSSGTDLAEAHLKREYNQILDYLLDDKGLGYGSLPKGLLKFHNYEGGARTPVEEHMVEGSQYATSMGEEVHLHFTVSPEHQSRFEAHVAEIQPVYEKEFGVTIHVTYSIQKPSTDTIAVDMNNQPFREADGTLLFRPAGHGALLENLNDIDADMVFIKNIDNVVPDHLKPDTITYKQVIGGIMADIQTRLFGYLEQLDKGVSIEEMTEIQNFANEHLGIKVDSNISREELKEILNRPIRVCGMVKSEGDPGGGPFWVEGEGGSITLQVVETAQINLKDSDQKEVFGKATHFNPVDIVCGTKNYKGEKFDLMKYRDPSTGFITQKSKDGKDLKAQELPGLWNGSMAHWNSIFVEVPVSTFNPVKAVTDLLLPAHQ